MSESCPDAMKVDWIKARGNFYMSSISETALSLSAFTKGASFSVYVWKYLGGVGEKPSCLSKLFPARAYGVLESLHLGQVSASWAEAQ